MLRRLRAGLMAWLVVISSACGAANSTPPARACIPVDAPVATPTPTATVPLGQSTLIRIAEGVLDVSIGVEGQVVPIAQQSAAFQDALRSCARQLGGMWEADCGANRHDYTSAARKGYCTLVSQTDEDRARNWLRALFMPLMRDEQELAAAGQTAQLVVFEKVKDRWTVVHQEQAFRD